MFPGHCLGMRPKPLGYVGAGAYCLGMNMALSPIDLFYLFKDMRVAAVPYMCCSTPTRFVITDTLPQVKHANSSTVSREVMTSLVDITFADNPVSCQAPAATHTAPDGVDRNDK